MAITYTSTPWYRPSGVGTPPLPLILRNPQSSAGVWDQFGDGPATARRFGPSDYRMYFEGFNNASTNFIGYATSTNGWAWTKDAGNPVLSPNVSPDWEKSEVAPDCWFYNPFAGEWWMYYHGGNNVSGDRKIGLLTSPSGLPGTWTRYGSNPILVPGTAGAWDDRFVADCIVFPLAANDYRMIYYGRRASDGITQFGYATSTDGKSWTKYGSNPIITNGTGNIANGVVSPWGYRDGLGRIHLWYSGRDASDVERVLYAYSDNFTTWTTNAADVISSASGTSTDPDAAIGNVVKGWDDAGILWFSQNNFNFASYSGDAVGRLDGRGLYWIPKQETGTPVRPGRAYTLKTANSRSAINSLAGLLNSTVATIWSTFRCPPGNTNRQIYSEYAAFNKQIFVRLATDGKLNLWWRTPTAIVNVTTSGRYDDNQEHRLLVVRRASADFEVYIDGTSVLTSVTDPTTDATATSPCWGNWDPAAASDEPIQGIIRESLTIQGRALTLSEETTLVAADTLPAGVTATCWVKHGSGGLAGPDAAYGGATYGTTITGTVVVETLVSNVVPVAVSKIDSVHPLTGVR